MGRARRHVRRRGELQPAARTCGRRAARTASAAQLARRRADRPQQRATPARRHRGGTSGDHPRGRRVGRGRRRAGGHTHDGRARVCRGRPAPARVDGSRTRHRWRASPRNGERPPQHHQAGDDVRGSDGGCRDRGVVDRRRLCRHSGRVSRCRAADRRTARDAALARRTPTVARAEALRGRARRRPEGRRLAGADQPRRSDVLRARRRDGAARPRGARLPRRRSGGDRLPLRCGGPRRRRRDPARRPHRRPAPARGGRGRRGRAHCGPAGLAGRRRRPVARVGVAGPGRHRHGGVRGRIGGHGAAHRRPVTARSRVRRRQRVRQPGTTGGRARRPVGDRPDRAPGIGARSGRDHRGPRPRQPAGDGGAVPALGRAQPRAGALGTRARRTRPLRRRTELGARARRRLDLGRADRCRDHGHRRR